MFIKKIFFSLSLIFSFLYISSALALTDEIPQLDKAAVLRSAAEITTENYPDADDVLIDDYTRVKYNADGTSLELCDSYQKILTEKGKRDNSEITMHFTIPYDKVAVLLLEIIKPDGTTIPVDIAAQSKEMISSGQMNSNIYNPNDKELRVGIPNLQINDIVHTITRSETVKPIVPNTWSDIVIFEYTSPIKHHTYEVIAPHERPLKKIALRDEVKGSVKASKTQLKDGISYKWEVFNVPQIFPEPNMPALFSVVQRLIVSTIEDWEEISKWYWNISEPHLAATTPEMRQKVDEITKGINDPREKLEAIFRWVSQEIRYMGITIEDDAPGFEPHDVKLTFEQRHGVCRDKAALLVAMLRMAGLDAYPVIIYVGPKRDPEVPMARFNHAVVAAELPLPNSKEKETILMDPTNESTKDLFPAYLNDRSYIIAKSAGETLRVSPITPAEENAVSITTKAAIDDNGLLNATTTIAFNGINDSAYRGFLARTTSDERKRFFEALIGAVAPEATLTSVELTPKNLLDTTLPLSAKLAFKTDDNMLIQENGVTMFVPPYFGTRLGLVNFALGKTGLEKRRYPLNIDFACGVEEEIDIELAPSLGAIKALPDVTTISNDGVSWNGQALKTESGLNIKRQFYLKVVEFTPQQYQTLKNDLKVIEYDKRKRPILEQGDGSDRNADLILLDRTVKFFLNDSHTWREEHYYKKKILTYNGKKDAAEVKITYNSALEDVKVLEAKVTNGTVTKEISPNEINLMDAAWVASAPRYPATKTLVLSLPSVEIGSIVEYKIAIEKKDSPFFSTLQIFRDFNPLKRKTVTIDAPKDLALTIKTDDNGTAIPDNTDHSIFDITDTTKGDRRIRTWTVSDQKPLTKEDNLPPAFAMTAMLHVTSGDWQIFSKSIYDKLKEAAEKQPQTALLAQQITGKAANRDEKIIAIRDFVAKNIRRVGPTINMLPLSAITASDQTIKDGYGNNSDRAVVQYALLKEAGLNPEYLLVDSSRLAPELLEFRKNASDLDTFDLVLVKVQGDSEEIILNDTNQYAHLGTTPSEGRLSLTERADLELLSIPQNLQNCVHVNYDLTIEKDGTALLTWTKESFGTAYASGKKFFSEMTPEERTRYQQEQVAAISQSAILTKSLAANFNVYPSRETFSVKVPHFAVQTGDYLYFNLPRTVQRLFNVHQKTRENPLAFSSITRLKIDTTVTLPKEFSNIALLPQPQEWHLPNDSGKIILKVDLSKADAQKKIRFSQRVDLKPLLLEAADYHRVFDIDKTLALPASRIVLLKK